MFDGFTYGDHSTRDFAMHCEKYPAVNGAKRKYSSVSVPGRNGSLHYDQGVYENYTQPYECYFHAPDVPTPKQAHAIKAWLLSGTGYRRLQDDYDPDHYRMAYFTGPLNVANVLHKYGRCTVTFDCDPRSFLRIGDYPQVFTEDGIIVNPTAFAALPLIRVYGDSAGTVSINGVTVTIHELTDVLTLDCDLQDVYRQVADSPVENKNSVVTAPEFPKLNPGANAVAFTGGVTMLEIIPRWWEL